MKIEQKEKILKTLEEDRNNFVIECEKRITAEQGKILGADYMYQRFLDILYTDVESQESEDK